MCEGGKVCVEMFWFFLQQCASDFHSPGLWGVCMCGDVLSTFRMWSALVSTHMVWVEEMCVEMFGVFRVWWC